MPHLSTFVRRNTNHKEIAMGTYGANELASGFRTVRKNTIQIAEDIPESQYDFVAAPGTMSVGATLKHIAISAMMYEDMHREKRVTTLSRAMTFRRWWR